MSEPRPCKVWMLWAGKKGTRSYCGGVPILYLVSLHERSQHSGNLRCRDRRSHWGIVWHRRGWHGSICCMYGGAEARRNRSAVQEVRGRLPCRGSHKHCSGILPGPVASMLLGIYPILLELSGRCERCRTSDSILPGASVSSSMSRNRALRQRV